MSYKINFTDTLANPQGIIVQDQTVNNTETDLSFVGKNFNGFSEYIGENFLHLLENFARNTSPPRPIKGQLWYDTGTNTIPAKPQLKVFDGTNWTEAGNIKKSIARPTAENSISGDLWVDTSNQQLYLYTGTTWVLVGPQFNQSSSTGFRAEGIIDSATNTEKNVISFIVEEKRLLIISRYEFVPKIRIAGFQIIRQGLNLSNEDLNLNGLANKFWGLSEKANALTVGNTVVSAENFLRSDTISTTGFQFNIRSGAGLSIGPGLETTISSNSNSTVVHQTTPGANIILRTTQTLGTFNDSLNISSEGKVGINKLANEALDVEGNVALTGNIKVNDSTDSTSTNNGALVVVGGASIGKTLNVGGSLSVTSQTVLGSLNVTTQPILLPKVNELFDIGSPSLKFKNVYAQSVQADTFIGNVQGFLSGNISGSAASLSNFVNVSLDGDVISNTVPFNGTDNIVLTTSINDDIIVARPEATSVLESDQFLLYRQNATPTLRKINKSTLFASIGSIPPGAIVPFAGDIVPFGYLLCDGGEQSRSVYPELFSIIGFKYRPESQLIGFQTFALPDLRGRFPAGRELMDNNNTVNKEIRASEVTRLPLFDNAVSATFLVSDQNIINGPFQLGKTLSGTGLNTSLSPAIIASIQPNTPEVGQTTLVVSCQPQTSLPQVSNIIITSIGTTDAGGGNPDQPRLTNANNLGNVGGNSSLTLTVNQLPEHTHNFEDSQGNQYYAINNSVGAVPESNVSNGQLFFTGSSGHLLSNSGGISGAVQTGQPLDIINPYLTINYIIFTGRI